ncbi:phytase [Hahella sp. CR1]|uniref:phytase n=1 Tax=Hahella sp. CR1 TaxID=2992807 RepID=UPI00244141FB|nr:phytase [Hahella sp. CR1]MDG9670508.1 phytase [Hahella sp. CR1]
MKLAKLLPFTLAALSAQALAAPPEVVARFETEAFYDDDAGKNSDADDPAIWAHPEDPAKSLVIATLKEGGLVVFNMQGQTLQHIDVPLPPSAGDVPGRFNNVDLVYGLKSHKHENDFAVVIDRGADKLRFYRINPDYNGEDIAPLTDVTSPDAPWIFSDDQDEVNEQRTGYGLAVSKRKKHKDGYAVISQRKDSDLAIAEFKVTKEGLMTYEVDDLTDLPDEFELSDDVEWTPCQDDDDQDPQVEGMVIDERNQVLYAAQEQVGVWRIPMDDPDEAELVDVVASYGVPYTREWDEQEEEYVCTLLWDQDPGHGGQHLKADVEGLTIYYGPGKSGYLLASSQGDDRYVVYDRQGSNAYVGEFAIVDGPYTDGTQETDGGAVINVNMGPDFPYGLLVVQDGDNTPDELDDEGKKRDNTNFKFVPWQDVANSQFPPLMIETDSWHPRRKHRFPH